MANQVGFTVDVNQCTGCRACEVACKTEYDLEAGAGRRRRVIERTMSDTQVRTFFISLACNHCKDPACVKACPDVTSSRTTTEPWPTNTKALFKTTTQTEADLYSGGLVGVVRLNQDKCIACRRCEWACPYGAPQFNPNGAGPGQAKVHKCEFCYQRIASWNTAHSKTAVSGAWATGAACTPTEIADKRRQTACSATCIGRALHGTLVDTNPAAPADTRGVTGNHDYADFADYVALGSDPSPGTGGAHNPGIRTFAKAGEAGRGSAYLTHYALTNPAIKICNRVYKNRSGGGVS